MNFVHDQNLRFKFTTITKIISINPKPPITIGKFSITHLI